MGISRKPMVPILQMAREKPVISVDKPMMDPTNTSSFGEFRGFRASTECVSGFSSPQQDCRADAMMQQKVQHQVVGMLPVTWCTSMPTHLEIASVLCESFMLCFCHYESVQVVDWVKAARASYKVKKEERKRRDAESPGNMWGSMELLDATCRLMWGCLPKYSRFFREWNH